MKIKFNLFFKSFFLSFIAFALIAGIIITSLYIDKNSVDPTQKESTVLVGITGDDGLISLTVLNFDPENTTVTFLTIPDNTLLSENKILQDMYRKGNIDTIKSSIEGLIGAKIDRYMIFSIDAVAELTNKVGKFTYYVTDKFIYNGSPYTGWCNIDGELTRAMFTYSDYDMKKVSMADMGTSYLTTFLTEHGNYNSLQLIKGFLESDDIRDGIDTDLSQKETDKYFELLCDYQTLTHKTVNIKGQTDTTSSNRYFTPDKLISDKNIFK